MSSMIYYKGTAVPTDGLHVQTYVEHPCLALHGEDVAERDASFHDWIRSIILHTTKGRYPVIVLPGKGPHTDVGKDVARFWSTSPKPGGAHFTVDMDGTVYQHCDLIKSAQHAGVMNSYSIGIEIYQDQNRCVYEYQLESTAFLVYILTSLLSIQRQMPRRDHKKILFPDTFFTRKNAATLCGIFGHRHVTSQRGPGDPGDQIFDMLFEEGCETMDFSTREDLRIWKARQSRLNVHPADGLPGPQTIKALKLTGNNPDGVYIHWV